jgi:DNA repair exonuclease SbcCD nuclease subunit
MDMLVGNHDTPTKDMSVHALHWLNSIAGVRVIDEATHFTDSGFSFLPYTEDEEVLKKFFAEAGDYCFMHQGMVDVPMASGFVVNEIMNYEMIPEHVKHVFTGHYHPYRAVGNKATNVGSVMQHNWADMGDQRGFLIFDTADGTIKQINAHAPEFRTLDMQGCDLLGKAYGTPRYFDNSYIRVKNFKESTMEQVRNEILEAGASTVEFVVKPKNYKSTVVKAVSGKGLSVPELVREYEKKHSISEERRNVGKELMK